MFDTVESASIWFDIFNGILLLGAFFVLLGTWGTIKTAAIKEKFSDERISANEAEAKRAVAESDKANAALGSAQADIANAVAATAQANERTALLERDAAQARAEQERLKASLAWRRITTEQFNVLNNALKGRQIKIWVSSIRNDPEALTFRADIEKALQNIGLRTSLFTGWEVAVGLSITGSPAGPDRDLIIAAFKEAGMPLDESQPNGMMPNELEIIVGSKPRPF